MTPPSVRLVRLDAGDPGCDRAGLRLLAHGRLVTEVGATTVGRLCPRCGSSEHGRPWVRVGEGTAPYVSLAYTRGVALLAWSWAGPLGVDVERVGADAGVYGDLAGWTRAEAVLKATGEGLHRDPTDLPEMWSAPLDLGPDLVGTVALAGVPSAVVVR